jgi:hypothetical protein
VVLDEFKFVILEFVRIQLVFVIESTRMLLDVKLLFIKFVDEICEQITFPAVIFELTNELLEIFPKFPYELPKLIVLAFVATRPPIVE